MRVQQVILASTESLPHYQEYWLLCMMLNIPLFQFFTFLWISEPNPCLSLTHWGFPLAALADVPRLTHCASGQEAHGLCDLVKFKQRNDVARFRKWLVIIGFKPDANSDLPGESHVCGHQDLENWRRWLYNGGSLEPCVSLPDAKGYLLHLDETPRAVTKHDQSWDRERAVWIGCWLVIQNKWFEKASWCSKKLPF